MSKEKKQSVLDPFQEWSHRFGRNCMLLFFVYMLAIPIIVGVVFDAFPQLSRPADGLRGRLHHLYPHRLR